MFKVYITALSKDLDSDLVTPSDFTLLVSDLPKNRGPEEVKEFFQTVIPAQKMDVVDVCYTYMIKDIFDMDEKLKSLHADLIHIYEYQLALSQKHGCSIEELNQRGICLIPPPRKHLFSKKEYVSLEELK